MKLQAKYVTTVPTGLLKNGIAYLAIKCCHSRQELFRYPDSIVWGKSKPDTNISPFQYKVDDKDMQDLKTRIANWRQHKPLEDVGRFYGITYKHLEDLVTYWREEYDFSKFESRINSIPQFTTVIQGLKVHFIHAKADASAKRRIPLLLVHGWPDSVLEFYRAIPLLTKPDKDGVAFDVIAPSLPGFAFSETATKPGMNLIAMTQVLHSLMDRLGYDKYVYQGGDWGSVIGQNFCRMYPENLIGYHSNHYLISIDGLASIVHLAAALIAPNLVLGKVGAAQLARYKIKQLFLEDTGYFHVHATKPDTLAVALSDSPVGFLAWVAEQFESLSDHAEMKGEAGGISNDDLLTNVMVYWFTNQIASASRLYKEFVQSSEHVRAYSQIPIQVPSAIACFPLDKPCAPEALAKHSLPNLVQHSVISQGGHFAAMEEPELFVNDVRQAVSKMLAHSQN